MVRMKGLEPSRLAALAPKASVSTNSTTSPSPNVQLLSHFALAKLRLEFTFVLSKFQTVESAKPLLGLKFWLIN